MRRARTRAMVKDAAMGAIVGLLIAAMTMPAAAVAATTAKNFNLATTRDLVAVCTAPADDPLRDQATELCLGYVAGLAGLHGFLAASHKLAGGPLACPAATVTREQFAREIVAWANAHAQYMDEQPIATIVRAASATYPCARSGSSAH